MRSTPTGRSWNGTSTFTCPWEYAYTVEIDPGTNPIRFLLTEVFGEGILSPLATVTITDATGHIRRFQTPDRAGD